MWPAPELSYNTVEQVKQICIHIRVDNPKCIGMGVVHLYLCHVIEMKLPNFSIPTMITSELCWSFWWHKRQYCNLCFESSQIQMVDVTDQNIAPIIIGAASSPAQNIKWSTEALLLKCIHMVEETRLQVYQTNKILFRVSRICVEAPCPSKVPRVSYSGES